MGVLEEKKKINHNFRIRIKQSIKNIAYIWHLFNILGHYCASTPKLSSTSLKGKIFYCVVLETRSYPCFTVLSEYFIINNKKVVPENIYELLCPVAIAH